MRRFFKILNCLALLIATATAAQCCAQDGPVTLNIIISRTESANAKMAPGKNAVSDASNVVVWLTPLDRSDGNPLHQALSQKPPQLVQRHKTFEPHVLIVPVGTRVEFPNKDPFFHNIFSLFDGKRFDLGLYEAGTTRTVLFDRAGVSFLFCNIHAEMSAVVVSIDTPYFGLSDRAGNISIGNVPKGRYQVNVWFERASLENLKELSRTVTISDSNRNLGTVRVQENPHFTLAHKNKYGLDYVPPPTTDYDHP
jgi:plastocyanin